MGMTANQRLKFVRERAKFETAADAARRFGWNETTYRSHENGHRGFPAKRAPIYAKAYKVSEEWLLYGKGSPDDLTLAQSGLDAEIEARVSRLKSEARKREVLRYLDFLESQPPEGDEEPAPEQSSSRRSGASRV